jgi:hypothetical protein
MEGFVSYLDIWYDSLDEWSARRRASTHTGQHRTTRTNIHALSGVRTHNPSVRVIKAWAPDRTATMTGNSKLCRSKCMKRSQSNIYIYIIYQRAYLSNLGDFRQAIFSLPYHTVKGIRFTPKSVASPISVCPRVLLQAVLLHGTTEKNVHIEKLESFIHNFSFPNPPTMSCVSSTWSGVLQQTGILTWGSGMAVWEEQFRN